MDICYKIKKIVQQWKYRKLKKGDNSRINIGVYINRPENMMIGNNSYINGGNFSIGDKSKIIIGNDCLISYNVHFRTMSHNYKDKNIPINKQGEFQKDIVINDVVWVGYGAQIMPGITLHKGCVVGAGAVVTKDVPEYAVVGGVPAKILKYREYVDREGSKR